jgi:hypothetical protein
MTRILLKLRKGFCSCIAEAQERERGGGGNEGMYKGVISWFSATTFAAVPFHHHRLLRVRILDSVLGDGGLAHKSTQTPVEESKQTRNLS